MIRIKIRDLPEDAKVSPDEIRRVLEGIDTLPSLKMPLRRRGEVSNGAVRAEAYWKTAHEPQESLRDLVQRNPLKQRLPKRMIKEIPLVSVENADLLYVDTGAFAELGIPVGKYGRIDEKMAREILSVMAVRPAKEGETPTLTAVATRYSDQGAKGGVGTVRGDGRAGIIGRPMAAVVKTDGNTITHRLLNLRLKGIPTGLAPRGVPKGDGHADGRLPDKSAVANSLQAAYLYRNGIRTNRALAAAHTHEVYEYSFNINGRCVSFRDRVGFQLMAGAFDRLAHLNYLRDAPEEMRAFLDDVSYQLGSELGRKSPLSHAGLFRMLVRRKAHEFADMYWARALHGSTTFDNIGLLESVDQGLVVTVDRAHPTYRPIQHISPGFAQEGTRVLDAIADALTDVFWRTATRSERMPLSQVDVERLVKRAFDERMQANALEHLGLDLDRTMSLMRHHKDLAVTFASTVRRVGEEQEVGRSYEMGPGKEEVTDPARYDIFAALSVLVEVAASDLPQQEKELRLIEALSPLVPDDSRDRQAARWLLNAAAPLVEAGLRGLAPEARQEALRVIGEEARRANRPVEAFSYSALRGWCEDKLEKLHSGGLSRTRFQAEIEALLRDNVRRGPQTPRAIAHGVREESLPRDADGRMELFRIEENGVCIRELSDGASDMIQVSLATDPLGLRDPSRYRLTLSLSEDWSVELKPTAVVGDEAVFSVPVPEPPRRIRVGFHDAGDAAHRWDQDGLGFGAGHVPILSSRLVEAELAALAERTARGRRRTPQAPVRATSRRMSRDGEPKTVQAEFVDNKEKTDISQTRVGRSPSPHRYRYSSTIQRLWQEYRRVDPTIPADIAGFPLLKELVELFRPSQPLRDSTALLIQHQCANHYALAVALMELGIRPARLFWIDIPYSSHWEVRERLYKLGVPRRNFRKSCDYRVLQPFAPYMRSRVEKRVASLLAHSPKETLVVLDDGSYFLEALSGFRRRFQNVVVVEQTTRGLIKIEQNPDLKDLAETTRLINVARSWPKKHLESPFIGLDVCASLRKKIDLHLGRPAQGNCLVLGYGAIGEQIAEFLSDCLHLRKNDIYIYDTDKKKMGAAGKAGFSIWDRSHLDTRFKLVIGCSGRSSFLVDDRFYLDDGAVLASASSGSVELSREDFIELADTSPVDDIRILRRRLIQHDCHSDIEFSFAGSRATFLNGGFPVNFDGRVSTIPWRHIQITPALMIAGAVQGVLTNKKGIIELCPFLCTWIDTRFRQLIGQESVILKKRFMSGGPFRASRSPGRPPS